MKHLLKDSQGMALVVAIFITTILLTITGAGLLFSQLELKMASHHKTGTMAFFATEAGLQHAWRELENGDGVNDFDAIHTSAAGTVIVSNSAFSGTTYTATLVESLNNPRRIRVASVGTAPNNSQARLEVWLRRDLGTAPKALITNGDLKLNGNPNLLGLRGGAHTNDDMQVSGNAAVQMADGLTASNSVTGGGGLSDGMDVTGLPCVGSAACALPPGQQPDEYRLDTQAEKDAYEAGHNNAPPYSIPKINPADYAQNVADLGAAGNGYICRLDDTVQQGGTCGPDGLCWGGTSVPNPTGWKCQNGRWEQRTSNAADGVFYAEKGIVMSGSAGSSTSPLQATLIARDSIEISGSPYIRPYPAAITDLQNHLLVTGNDLTISGNMTANYQEGAIFVHQQVKINGNPEIKGFIMAGDGLPTWSGDPFTEGNPGVTMNEVSGNPTITYNGDLGVSLLPPAVTQIGWYQSF